MKLYVLKPPLLNGLLVVFACLTELFHGVVSSEVKVSAEGCVDVDELCLGPEEVPNYEAIKTLHAQLDDDSSGHIDVSESVEFLKEELQYAKGYEKRQKVFHHNDDEYISVRELWYMWKKSEVHNWTVEQTVAWLVDTVELEQYASNFYANAVNGSILPSTIISVLASASERRNQRYMIERLAANNEQFLTKVLGIKDPKHRSKITIKAMDAVLFGPPKGSHVKDLVLVSLLTLTLIGCFKAYQRNRENEGRIRNLLEEMENLRVVEANFRQLEQRTPPKIASKEHESCDEIKDDSEEVQKLKLLLEKERERNEQMEEEIKRSREGTEVDDDQQWSAPIDLQYWLQLTYERERIAFEKKQKAAREQFSQAKDMCEKLKRQRRSLVGMLSSVHGKMDNVDQSISQAKNILEEVTHEIREREQRWHNIEMLAGCTITTNAGLHALELMLRPEVQVNGRPHPTYASSIVQQLLCSQSALMFLTMGGCTGGTSYYGGSSLNSSCLIGTPRDSMADVRSTSGSIRKKGTLIPRDSGSSIGSDSSSGAHSNILHHSYTFSGVGPQLPEDDEGLRRVASTSSLRRMRREVRERSKESNESSNDDTDGYVCGGSETDGFSMGGSLLTLNSDIGKSQTSTQVSSLGNVSSSTLINVNQTSPGDKDSKTSPKRSPMRKSYSQDPGGSSRHDDTNLKEREHISASEPALDRSSITSKKIAGLPPEEGNHSDSSLKEDRSQIASPIKKKSQRGWFRNGISNSMKFNRSKKPKDSDKDSIKENPSKT